MKIIRDFTHCPPDCKDAVVALGNFDGVHRGHRAILETTKQLARASGRPGAVMTFEPHPREFFARTQAPFHIYPLRRKLALLRECGIDIVYLARFNATLAATSAQDFVQRILAGQLNARHAVTGNNFAFGKGREGTTEFLDRAFAALGRGYTALPGVLAEDGRVISSTAIREALAGGDIAGANNMLGAPYVIAGRIRHGDKRGRLLGFPTANIGLGHLCRPRYGVYAATARLDGGAPIPAVVNIGIRPTFSASDPLVEAHLFGASGDWYGKRLELQPVSFLRDEKRFDGPQALSEQILRDCETARAMLGA